MRNATRIAALLAALVAVEPAVASAAKHAAAPPAGALRANLPTARAHSEFTVDVNRKGQVVRARSAKRSSNAAFDALTYGNAMQVFIRTRDGKSVSGVYRLAYDYDPSTKRVHRDVTLVHAGGTDPNALGAVTVMGLMNRRAKADAAKHATAALPAAAAGPGVASESYTPLPSLRSITGK